MRRARLLFLEEWVHLLWRCGRFGEASRLLGASNAEMARIGLRQPNEARLLATVHAALERELGANALADLMARGGALSEAELHSLIAATLETLPGSTV